MRLNLTPAKLTAALAPLALAAAIMAPTASAVTPPPGHGADVRCNGPVMGAVCAPNGRYAANASTPVDESGN
jgi:hypothetical protein